MTWEIWGMIILAMMAVWIISNLQMQITNLRLRLDAIERQEKTG